MEKLENGFVLQSLLVDMKAKGPLKDQQILNALELLIKLLTKFFLESYLVY